MNGPCNEKPVVWDPLRRDGGRRRAGAVLVAALLCLLIVMLMASTAVRALMLRQRAARWDERQLQCLYLLESAIDRAIVRCHAEPGYPGETWTVALDDHGAVRPAVATIRVEPVADEPLRRRLQIEARWPDDPVHRVRQTRDTIITLSHSGANR